MRTLHLIVGAYLIKAECAALDLTDRCSHPGTPHRFAYFCLPLPTFSKSRVIALYIFSTIHDDLLKRPRQRPAPGALAPAFASRAGNETGVSPCLTLTPYNSIRCVPIFFPIVSFCLTSSLFFRRHASFFAKTEASGLKQQRENPGCLISAVSVREGPRTPALLRAGSNRPDSSGSASFDLSPSCPRRLRRCLTI